MSGHRHRAVRVSAPAGDTYKSTMQQQAPFDRTPSAGEESGALFRKMAVAHVRRGKALIGVVQGDGMPVEP